MSEQDTHPGEEVKRLQRCVNDLVSLLALPALWSGGNPSQIACTLIDVLQHLLELDLIYIQLNDPSSDARVELACVAQSAVTPSQAREIGAKLHDLWGDDSQKSLSRTRHRLEDKNLSIVPLRLGLHGEIGMLVAGAERPDFPGQTEDLLLRVAANYAIIALHEARLRNQQKRLADELDQRVAERTSELGAANQQLQLQVGILQLIPVAAWTLRPDGTPDFVNRIWLEYTGQAFDYVVSKPEAWMVAVHPDDREIASASFWEGVRMGQDFAMETRCRRATDGAYRWQLIRAVALRDANGKILKFVGTTTDIQDLKRSHQELRQMTETIPEMLWSATPDGAIDYCNTRLLDYTGLSAGEVLGKGWTKLIHLDDVESAARAWMSCVASGAAYHVEVRTFHVLDRTYRWCVMSAQPLRDQDGRILKWHGTVVDMHDWKQAQEALRHTQAELANMTRVMTVSQLTASIAHEVNQPLTGVITNASTCLRMLDADPPDIEGAHETARRIIRDGNRASEVITGLRALFSKRQVMTEPVDLNEAAREVIALLMSKLQRNNVNLRSELADDLPLVTGDRVQLQQVIMNLLQNASDAMNNVHDRVRQLLIHTQHDDAEHVRLTVKDSGIGLDPQTVNRLFDPFYTNKNSGMGIGLSVSRSIIENHRGRIWAKANDGPGATFSFSIPRSPGGAVGDRQPHPARRTAPVNTREIVRNRNG